MIVQSLQITLMGMLVVFFVLAILALLLKIESFFMAPKVKETVKDNEFKNIKTTKDNNSKVIAAISAAVYTYLEEDANHKKE